MYYLNARHYVPVTARFMQEDTYRGNPNDPLSLNLYTYCHNEPIMYSDPTGHRRVTEYEDKTVIQLPDGKIIVQEKSKKSLIEYDEFSRKNEHGSESLEEILSIYSDTMGANFENWGNRTSARFGKVGGSIDNGTWPEDIDNFFEENGPKVGPAIVSVLEYLLSEQIYIDTENRIFNFEQADDKTRAIILGNLSSETIRDFGFGISTIGISKLSSVDDLLKYLKPKRIRKGYLNSPATKNGTLNIGARGKTIDGAYNIDIDPKAVGVHYGDAYNLSNIKTGSQSKIIFENPYGFDPLNPEVLRVLSPEGKIVITGSRSNFKNIISSLDEKGLKILGDRVSVVNDGSFLTTTGNKIKSATLDQYTIVRK